jgi:hypothetical protein
MNFIFILSFSINYETSSFKIVVGNPEGKMLLERISESRKIWRCVLDSSDRLCGLVVRVPGYRFRDPGSIPGATRFFLRSGGSGTGSTQPLDDT